MNTPSVAVLGLGIIGSTWARHLENDGVLGAAWNRTPQPGFPRWVNHPAEAAKCAETLIIVVADPAAVESVLLALAPQLTPRHLVIQSSTIDPESSQAFAALVAQHGATYVEAPFTGSKPAAEQRQTIFYLGGEPAAVERAQPILARISKQQFVIGAGAQAATLKLACNLQIVTQLEALCEALAWCRQAEISDEVFFSALRTNAAWSGVAQLKEPKLRARDYAPQFSIKHMLKDLRLALATAPGQLPVVETVAERLQAVQDRGGADDDMSALYRLLD
jgi:3-hydroxyisobutyrate dehydrogenase-like beta-hydroxyacid dehydrogenase